MLFEIEDIRKNNNLFNIDEGFNKGNMFKDLYDPYKNYEVKKIIPTTEKDLLLYNLYKYSFAINDLKINVTKDSDLDIEIDLKEVDNRLKDFKK